MHEGILTDLKAGCAIMRVRSFNRATNGSMPP